MPPADPWSGPALADFALIERSGREVTRADLLGRPVILDFIFTTCTGPCPSMSAGLAQLQETLAGKPVRLLSVSVDPELDTPEVLSAYADDLGADPEQWWFLTGAEDQIVQLATSVYMTPQRAADGEARLGEQVTHSTKFVVLDGDGVVRGFYDGQTAEGRQGAAERALHLGR